MSGDDSTTRPRAWTTVIKNYVGTAVWDEAEQMYIGRVENTRAVIQYRGRTPEEATDAMRDLLEAYLAKCRADGVEPEPPIKVGRTDWARVMAMTDEEVEEAARNDPDAQPMTEADFARMKRVVRCEHKGYVARAVCDASDAAFSGQVRNTRAVIHFTGKTVEETRLAMRDSVEDYLAMCAEAGREPEAPGAG